MSPPSYIETARAALSGEPFTSFSKGSWKARGKLVTDKALEGSLSESDAKELLTVLLLGACSSQALEFLFKEEKTFLTWESGYRIKDFSSDIITMLYPLLLRANRSQKSHLIRRCNLAAAYASLLADCQEKMGGAAHVELGSVDQLLKRGAFFVEGKGRTMQMIRFLEKQYQGKMRRPEAKYLNPTSVISWADQSGFPVSETVVGQRVSLLEWEGRFAKAPVDFSAKVVFRKKRQAERYDYWGLYLSWAGLENPYDLPLTTWLAQLDFPMNSLSGYGKEVKVGYFEREWLLRQGIER